MNNKNILKNSQRKYFGLNPIRSNEEVVELRENFFIVFNNNIITKIFYFEIKDDVIISYYEGDYDIKTSKREYILPKTAKGEKKKIIASNLDKMYGSDIYIRFSKDYGFYISHYKNNLDFYTDIYNKNRVTDFKDLVRKFIEDSSANHITKITKYKKNFTRQNVNFTKGIFFTFQIDRDRYAFGRVIADITKIRKENELDSDSYLNKIMTKPVLVSLIMHSSSKPNEDIKILKSKPMFPSQFIMDNNLFYGNYKIIGNLPLNDSEIDFPISLSFRNNQVIFSWGLICKKKVTNKFNSYRNPINPMTNKYFDLYNPYDQTGVRRSIFIFVETLGECIDKNSLDPYWALKYPNVYFDIRNPKNIELREKINSEFGLDLNKSYLENLISSSKEKNKNESIIRKLYNLIK